MIAFLIPALLISAFVLGLLGCFIAPREKLWVAALACAVLAVLLKVFGLA